MDLATIAGYFIIGLCVAASVLIFPGYVGAAFPKKVMRSLKMKMVLSTLFVIIAVTSALITRNTSSYAIAMLIGFAFSWLGDLLLGKGDTTKLFLAGSASFLAAHISYIVAYTLAVSHFFPELHFFDAISLPVFIGTVAFLVILCIATHPRFHGILPPMAIYAGTLVLMLAKAVSLGARLIPEKPAAILLPLGALCFFFADTTLGMGRFKMHKKTFFFKASSSISYFVAQMLLAATLLVINY